MSEEIRLEEAVEFAENPEPRCACVLLLDTSGSMAGEKIDSLNEGLKAVGSLIFECINQNFPVL
jgi:hypothetical protein